MDNAPLIVKVLFKLWAAIAVVIIVGTPIYFVHENFYESQGHVVPAIIIGLMQGVMFGGIASALLLAVGAAIVGLCSVIFSKTSSS
jgi:hypothetical protein